VLVVDDHVDSAEMLGMLLEQAGCEVRLAHCAGEARPAAIAFLPHVALIDIGLPDMDGHDLLAALRAEDTLAGCRFVALTGYAVDDLERRGKAGGFELHLTKPVDFPALYKAVFQDHPAVPAIDSR
jgi:CheY-like chemotaxis protein